MSSSRAPEAKQEAGSRGKGRLESQSPTARWLRLVMCSHILLFSVLVGLEVVQATLSPVPGTEQLAGKYLISGVE